MCDTGLFTLLTETLAGLATSCHITADPLRQGKIREDQHAGKLYAYDIIVIYTLSYNTPSLPIHCFRTSIGLAFA